MRQPYEPLRKLFWWLLVGSKGGHKRLMIIMALRQAPANANQLATKLGLNYKTIQHHLNVLMENRMIVAHGEKYNITYHLSPELLDNMDLIDSIIREAGIKMGEVREKAWDRSG